MSVSFLHHLEWLSTCFIYVNLIFCSKVLSSQGGSRFCRVSIWNPWGPLEGKEHKTMTTNCAEGTASEGPQRFSTSSFTVNSPRGWETTKPYISVSSIWCSCSDGYFTDIQYLLIPLVSEARKKYAMRLNSRPGPGPYKWFKVTVTLHSVIP